MYRRLLLLFAAAGAIQSGLGQTPPAPAAAGAAAPARAPARLNKPSDDSGLPEGAVLPGYRGKKAKTDSNDLVSPFIAEPISDSTPLDRATLDKIISNISGVIVRSDGRPLLAYKSTVVAVGVNWMPSR